MAIQDLVSFKNKCIQSWSHEFGCDEIIESFDAKFSNWVSQIPNESLEIVQILLENMLYFSRQSTNKWFVKLHNDLVSREGVTEENTVFTFIKSSDGISNSSNDYWTEYKSINRVNKNICYINIGDITNQQWDFIDNVILIDDFSGTGKSIKTEIEKYKEQLQGKNVFCITVCMMEKAIENLTSFGKVNGIKIWVLTGVTQKKAFEQALFPDNLKAKEDLSLLSEQLGIPTKYHFGYIDPDTKDESQSLLAFYSGTPNNTLGFIWCDAKGGYYSIFPRFRYKRPSWQTMNNGKQSRSETNYHNASKR